MTGTFSAAFNFGNPQAEYDAALGEKTYTDNGDYAAISAAEDPRCILVGRTGSGKSACLKELKRTNRLRAVTIEPTRLSFRYVTNSNAVKQLEAAKINLSPFFQALWKHVLVYELLKNEYAHTRKRSLASFVRGIFSRSRGATKAKEYLDQNEGYFWQQTDERIRKITKNLEDKLKTEGTVGTKVIPILDVKASAQLQRNRSTKITAEQVARYQQIADDTQVERLNEIIDLLDAEILSNSRDEPTYLLIDDLDTEWVDEKLQNQLIVALFQAIQYLKKVKRLKVIVALRTNIFIQIGKDPNIRAQQEKFDQLIIRLRWTEASLRGLMERRASLACEKYRVDPAIKLVKMLPGRSAEHGDAFKYILNRTLFRPRDVIEFMNLCVKEAAGKSAMSWSDIRAAEKNYSKGRLQALTDEWRNPYNDVGDVLEAFRGQPWRMPVVELSRLLDQLWSDRNTRTSGPKADQRVGTSLRSLANARASSTSERYRPVVNRLYDIGFLGVATSRGRRSVYSFEATAPERLENVRLAPYVEVQPMYRLALELTAPKRATSSSRASARATSQQNLEPKSKPVARMTKRTSNHSSGPARRAAAGARTTRGDRQ